MANETYSEKVSVNMNVATLASIDLLVDGGYYSNRSDFINQAVREALVQRQTTVDQLVAQNRGGSAPSGQWEATQGLGIHVARKEGEEKNWFMGTYGLTRRGVEELQAEGRTVSIRGYGLLVVSSDVPEDILFAVVASIQVRGKVKASDAVKAHYGLK